MQPTIFTPPPSTAATRRSAAACLAALAGQGGQRLPMSPRGALAAIAARLRQDARLDGHLHIVSTRAPQDEAPGRPLQASAWQLRFGRPGQADTPLLYLVHAQSVESLRALLQASCGRGIVCNDAEAEQARTHWPKGVQPALPAWLAAQPGCMPFDPASGVEARAILEGALRALYLDRHPGFYYLATHDADAAQDGALSADDAAAACLGMYRLPSAHGDRPAQVRLCGAGSTLASASGAAALLWRDWQVVAEVWSCPSYTRLARDAREAGHWNLCHPSAPPRSTHLQRCLGDSAAPVVAVSGYGRQIAGQIGGHLRARLIALDHDADASWMAIAALRALADEGSFDIRRLEQALRQYGHA